jgi:serine/threonine protein kinase
MILTPTSSYYLIIIVIPYNFLAPEIILYMGHNHAVDYWALGCLIYEMIEGFSPFYDNDGDELKVCNHIVEGEIDFSPISDELCKVGRMLESSLTTQRAYVYACYRT